MSSNNEYEILNNMIDDSEDDSSTDDETEKTYPLFVDDIDLDVDMHRIEALIAQCETADYVHLLEPKVAQKYAIDTIQVLNILNHHFTQLFDTLHKTTADIFYADNAYQESRCTLTEYAEIINDKKGALFQNVQLVGVAVTHNINAINLLTKMSDKLFNPEPILGKYKPDPLEVLEKTHCLLSAYNCIRCKTHTYGPKTYHLDYCLNTCTVCQHLRYLRKLKLKREAVALAKKVEQESETSPQEVSQQEIPQRSQQEIPQRSQQEIPQRSQQEIPQRSQQEIPQMAPQMVSQMAPQMAPQMTPEIIQQMVQQMVEQMVPQGSSQTIPYVESPIQYNSHIQRRVDTPLPTKGENQSTDLILTEDKYFFITLGAEREDGSNTYIADFLSGNFSKMMPGCYPTKAFGYTIELSTKGVPNLYGLIRYDAKGQYNTYEKANIFTNKILSEISGTRNDRFMEITQLTRCSNKKRLTNRFKIIEIFNYITEIAPIVGSPLSAFLLNDRQITEPTSPSNSYHFTNDTRSRMSTSPAPGPQIPRFVSESNLPEPMAKFLQSEVVKPGTIKITMDHIKDLPLDILEKYSSDLFKTITYYKPRSNHDIVPKIMDSNLNLVLSVIRDLE
jgi:hypothetical protein